MEENQNKKQIKSFRDLEVFQNTYKVMLLVMKEVIPKLPVDKLVDIYDKSARQLYNLSTAWTKFKRR